MNGGGIPNSTTKTKAYLAGAIEQAPDHGVGKRDTLKPILEAMGIEGVNPCDFKYNQGDFPTMWSYTKDASHSLSDCLRYSSKIVDGDLQEILTCDVIIAILDENCGPGTGSELTLASHEGIPVIGLIIDDKEEYWRKIHPWILSRVDTFCFSVRELKKTLDEFVK